MKKYTSYILPLLLLIGITVLGYDKILYHDKIWSNTFFNFDIVIIAFYIFWMISETKVSHNDVKQEKVESDYGTREFYAFSQALTIMSALWFNPLWDKPNIYHIAGFIIFISGVSFRLWAIQTLGQYYSHIVRKITNHKIIDTGPYELLRHPAYAGMITAHIGVTVFYFNYVTLICLLVLISSIVVRIFVEEKTLINIKGYAEFSAKRKRIIPYVW